MLAKGACLSFGLSWSERFLIVLAPDTMETRFVSETNKAGIMNQHLFTYTFDFLSVISFACLHIWLYFKAKIILIFPI